MKTTNRKVVNKDVARMLRDMGHDDSIATQTLMLNVSRRLM